MSGNKPLILGEFSRKVDERNRLSLPSELKLFLPEEGNCVIVKERPGCVSLWEQMAWQEKLDARTELIQHRIKVGDLDHRMPEVQMFGRLLSTRQKPLQIDKKGRFILPEGFREFLDVETDKEVMVVGAMICIEIWNPQKWVKYIERGIPKFQKLITRLSSN